MEENSRPPNIHVVAWVLLTAFSVIHSVNQEQNTEAQGFEKFSFWLEEKCGAEESVVTEKIKLKSNEKKPRSWRY